MKTKFLLFLLFYLLNIYAYSQNSIKMDNLTILTQSEHNDSNEVKHLINISEKYNFTDLQKSIKYAEKALKIAEYIKWNKGIAISYHRIASIYNSHGDFSNALKYRLEELNKWKKINNKVNICAVLGDIGISYSDQGNYSKAMEYYLSSLKMAEKIGFNERIIINLCNIGSVHKDQGNIDKALEFYTKSLKLAKEYNFKNFIAINQGNIGNLYCAQEKYSKALESYLIALNIDEGLGNKENSVAWVINIAGIYQFQSDSASMAGNIGLMKIKNKKALDFFFKALKLSEEIDNMHLCANILGNIGAIYITSKQYDDAKLFLQKSQDISKKINSKDELIIGYQRFYELYKHINNAEKALEYFEKYVSLKDSVFNEDNQKIISELQIKYETEKKESENKALIQRNEVQALIITNNQYLIIGLAFFFVLILSIIALLFRQNKLNSQKLTAQFEQKLLRTQMNPHFIFNSLTSIESFLYDHQPLEACEYISSFSRLMRLILENSAFEDITLEKEIETLECYLTLQKLRLDDNLEYSIEVDKSIYTNEIHLPPMLTQPFIENAIEHGFRGIERTGIINIIFSLNNNNLQIQVIDNGIGIEQAQHQKDLYKTHKSMAMQITTERLKYLNKLKKQKLSFTISDLYLDQQENKGTKIIFSIPV